MSSEVPVKGEQLYEGKAKIIYATSEPETYIQFFKDDASAFNAKKKGSIADKGVMNNSVSTVIFEYLMSNGIKTHFVKKISDREQVVKKVDIIPVEVVMRNRVAGSLAKKMGREEGTELKHPILEFYYKDDDLDDPMINTDYITAFELGNVDEIEVMSVEAKKINKLLIGFFNSMEIEVIDFKLEFGRLSSGDVVLADEISPDTCRLWDKKTGEKLDKDRFRFDLGKVEESYQEVLKRVTSKGGS